MIIITNNINVLILFGTFIGILFAPLGILYQDVDKAIAMMTSFWLFITPVVYPIPTEGTFALLVKLNPVTPLLITVRELATTGVLTQEIQFWVVSLITFISLFATWIFFRLAISYVI